MYRHRLAGGGGGAAAVGGFEARAAKAGRLGASMKVSTTLMAVGILSLTGVLHITVVVAPASAQVSQKVTPMTDDEFWRLIGRSNAGLDYDRQADLLESILETLPAGDILKFDAAFQKQMNRAYTWDLWGAAYVIHGGCSDDGFDYFRRWLISRGKDVFERALARPDDLADIIPREADEALEAESLGYAAVSAWQKKTGESAKAFNAAAVVLPMPADPAGEPFEEDEAHLAKRYPKLTKRFGDEPLY